MAIEIVELEKEELKEEELEDEDIEESEESSSDDSSYSPLYDWYDPSLAIYINEISRFPLLEREEEKALTLKIAETQVLLNTNTLTESEREKTNAELESSKDRMIRCNLRLVVKIATIYWRIVEGKMGLVDLIQEGSIGLMRAVEEFNPYKGFRFSTYAYPWIRQKITRAIAEKANIVRLPVHVVTRLGKVKKAMERIEEGGGVASVDSLAEVLGGHYSDDRVRKIIEVQKLQNPVSLNAILSSEKGGKSREFGDFIRDSESSPEEKALSNVAFEEIKAVRVF